MTTTAFSTGNGLRGITVVWIALCAMTVGSWWLSPAHPGGVVSPSVAITVAVIVVGFIKSRLVLRYFMEVRTAPRWLAIATDGWLLVLWGAVLVIYLW